VTIGRSPATARSAARLAGPLATVLALAASSALDAGAAFAQAGTWTRLPFDNVSSGPHMNIVLLTDGTLLAQSDNDMHVWTKLTPDASGSYVNGTWSAAASTQIGRRYYPYAVLKDGRVWIGGGEILSGSETDQAAIEIYDPLANTWTRGPDAPATIGDTAYQVLSDGRIIGGIGGAGTQFFDPAIGQWTAGPTKASGLNSGEQTWSLLPSGAVLDWSSVPQEKYIPSSNQWVLETPAPITLIDASNFEIGPAVFLPTGKLLAFGAFGRTVLYTPGASPTAAGSWATGPSVPPPSQPNGNPNGTQYTEDVPACIEPNGKVLIVSTDAPIGNSDGNFNEYDPATNTISPIPNPPLGFDRQAFLFQFLALPTGQVLLTGTFTNDFVYTPVGGPQASWRPTIQSITPASDGTFTLTGTQLNGLSQGASYGDEGNAQTNYPLVQFVTGSTVRYARTFNHGTMGFATGATPVQTHFTLPPNIPAGTYQVAVVTNGIASAPASFTVTSTISATPSVYSHWDTGYCANVTVTNTLPRPISAWTVTFNLATATINAQWNGVFTQTGSTLRVTNSSFNGQLGQGGAATFGFCTQAPPPVPSPVVTLATGS
jgi:hypothetical protein